MGTLTEPPFRSVGIVGLGLIGGSVAQAVGRAWPAVRVVAVDRPEVLAGAQRSGFPVEICDRIDDLRDVELVVLATPVPEIVQLVGAAARAGLTGLITDVGSTKRHILAAARDSRARFVGGHPVAGAATGGLAHARVDLFDRRAWLIVAGDGAEADVARLEQFTTGLGAAPRRMDADTHDRVMAYVSHLPQLLATGLMNTAGNAVGPEGLSAAGPGFSDMTRLAASPIDVWRGIVATNGDYIAEAVRTFVGALPKADGSGADTERLEALFREANSLAGRVDRKN